MAEIFHGLLIVYSDLLFKLSNAYFNLPTSSASASPSKGGAASLFKQLAVEYPLSYGQAVEEYEFLKASYTAAHTAYIQADC